MVPVSPQSQKLKATAAIDILGEILFLIHIFGLMCGEEDKSVYQTTPKLEQCSVQYSMRAAVFHIFTTFSAD